MEVSRWAAVGDMAGEGGVEGREMRTGASIKNLLI